LLCGCLCNVFILYKISRMRNTLSSGELLTIATTMMGNMWSMVFLGSSKGYHFFVPTNVCWFVFYFWWIPMFKCQDGNPFCFHYYGMFYMFFLSAHNLFSIFYHDFGFCITLLYVYRLTWCDVASQFSWRSQFLGFNSPSIALNSFRLWISMTFILCA